MNDEINKELALVRDRTNGIMLNLVVPNLTKIMSTTNDMFVPIVYETKKS
jgi:hypothetical protein